MHLYPLSMYLYIQISSYLHLHSTQQGDYALHIVILLYSCVNSNVLVGQ